METINPPKNRCILWFHSEVGICDTLKKNQNNICKQYTLMEYSNVDTFTEHLRIYDDGENTYDIILSGEMTQDLVNNIYNIPNAGRIFVFSQDIETKKNWTKKNDQYKTLEVENSFDNIILKLNSELPKQHISVNFFTVAKNLYIINATRWSSRGMLMLCSNEANQSQNIKVPLIFKHMSKQIDEISSEVYTIYDNHITNDETDGLEESKENKSLNLTVDDKLSLLLIEMPPIKINRPDEFENIYESNNWEQAAHELVNASKKFVVIVKGEYAESLVEVIYSFQHVLAIYILAENSVKTYIRLALEYNKKILGISSDISQIFTFIKASMEEYKQSFDIIPKKLNIFRLLKIAQVDNSNIKLKIIIKILPLNQSNNQDSNNTEMESQTKLYYISFDDYGKATKFIDENKQMEYSLIIYGNDYEDFINDIKFFF